MTTGIASPKPRWLVPSGLILLSVVPMIGGSIRLAELAGGAEITADNAQFFAAPLPVVLHILAAVPFCLLGALQFTRHRWHRITGRVIVPCGLIVALSGLWMTFLQPGRDGALLAGFRLVAGSAMVLSIVLGFLAIRRRQVIRHRAWMIRGCAVGIAAGTQALIQLPAFLLIGPPGQLAHELLLGAGWAINAVVAEWLIRRRPVAAVPVPRVMEIR